MRNWAGNLEYRARRVLEPRSIGELRAMVAASDRVRAMGTRHSFSDIGDTEGDLLSLASMPRFFELDPAAGTLTVDAGARFGEVAEELDASGYALENLPSLPHISVAGACLTGTHGSGDRHGVLATSILWLELVTADGELHMITADPGESAVEAGTAIPLQAVATSLGALGVVTAVALRVQPRYRMRQDVFEGLPMERLIERFDAITALGDSVSCFLDWRSPAVDQVWVKRRVPLDGAADIPVPGPLEGARPAAGPLHPIRGMDPEAATAQLGLSGPWHERLPHFRLSHTPSSGDELQSEYFVSRADLPAALQALWPLRHRLGALVQVSEIRTVAADDLWLSPAHGRATATIHFTWLPDGAAVLGLLPEVEAAIRPFTPRPHWAKLSTIPSDEVLAAYPMAAEFDALRRRVDRDGKLTTPFDHRLFDGAASR